MSPESSQTRLRPTAALVRWLPVAAMVVAAGALAALLLKPVDSAVAQVYDRESQGRLFAVPAQVGPDNYGVYIVDSRNDTICVYEYTPGRGSNPAKLRLTAARRFSFDMQLEEYNTEPSVREIRDLVEQHRRMDEASPPQ